MDTNSPNYGFSMMKVKTYDDENFLNHLRKAVEKDLLLGIYVPKQQIWKKNKID